MNEVKRIYVGCSLTQAPEHFKREVAEYKEQLRSAGYQVLEFLGLNFGTTADVYRWDIQRCVSTCDLVVGVCDNPSIGLGWELGVATQLGKDVLAIAHEQSSVTRLVLGAAAVEPNVHFMRYTQLADTLPAIEGFIGRPPATDAVD